MKISIETDIEAPVARVWNAWVTPADITAWNFALDDWCCPEAELDFVEGGTFSYRMEAKDGSMGFDFEGEFTEIIPYQVIRFELGDGREVSLEFMATDGGVKVTESFDAEDENAAEQQKQGWLSILNNFKKHVESKGI